MTVKQLHEILGKYVDVGAGDWIVGFAQTDRFKTRKEHRDWLKSNPGPKPCPCFGVGEVIIADEDDPDRGNTGIKHAILTPSLFIKDENRAFYHLPTQDHLTSSPTKREDAF